MTGKMGNTKRILYVVPLLEKLKKIYIYVCLTMQLYEELSII